MCPKNLQTIEQFFWSTTTKGSFFYCSDLREKGSGANALSFRQNHPILLISGPLSDKYGRKGGKLEGEKHHQCCHQGLLWSLLLAGVLTNGVFALLVFLDKRGADLPLFCYLAPRCSKLNLSLYVPNLFLSFEIRINMSNPNPFP